MAFHVSSKWPTRILLRDRFPVKRKAAVDRGKKWLSCHIYIYSINLLALTEGLLLALYKKHAQVSNNMQKKLCSQREL